jgi:hypothetical protein
MADVFPSIALQAALGIGAILFGAFSFLYGIFAQIITQDSENLPKIVDKLIILCRLIAVFSIFNLLTAIYSVVLMNLQGSPNIVLAIGIVGITGATAFMSAYMAFRMML